MNLGTERYIPGDQTLRNVWAPQTHSGSPFQKVWLEYQFHNAHHKFQYAVEYELGILSKLVNEAVAYQQEIENRNNAQNAQNAASNGQHQGQQENEEQHVAAPVAAPVVPPAPAAPVTPAEPNLDQPVFRMPVYTAHGARDRVSTSFIDTREMNQPPRSLHSHRASLSGPTNMMSVIGLNAMNSINGMSGVNGVNGTSAQGFNDFVIAHRHHRRGTSLGTQLSSEITQERDEYDHRAS